MARNPMAQAGVYIGLGANLPSPEHGTPKATLEAAMRMLESRGLAIVARSPTYESEPVPVSDQPWYLNAVIEVATDQSAAELLALLHSVENAFGRVRVLRNEARVLDLDLLAFLHAITLGHGWNPPPFGCRAGSPRGPLRRR